MDRRDRSNRRHATARGGREAPIRGTSAYYREHGDPYTDAEAPDWDEPRPRARARSRSRGRRSVRRTLFLALMVVLVPLALGFGLLWARVVAFNEEVSTASAYSSSLLFPLNGSDRVNVLMLGYGGEAATGHGGQFLADSINIISIDPQTDTTTTIPIPRDLWIEGMDELPQNGKVNEVFAQGYLDGGIPGGAEAMASALSEITGLEIEHWMAIDFAGFREMVDAVGGVTITNPTPFGYTWSEQKFFAGNWDGGFFEAGVLHLDGERALDYARTRYTSVQAESSDFARSVRQQRILGALRSKLGAGGLGSLGPGLGLMDAMAGRLDTDVSAIDLFLLSGHISSDRRIELSEGIVLRATTNTIGQYILIPIDWAGPGDYDAIADHLRTELARPIEAAAGTPSPASAP